MIAPSFITALAILALPGATTAFGQGVLTPSGAPAPMMKTLDQLEARTPIGTPGQVTTATIPISSPGSYVLMGPVTVASGTAIQINASDVTLDLNGFAITSTNPATGGYGILLGSGRSNIAIRNGHIRGQTTYSGTYTGGGFSYGIYSSGAANISVDNVSLHSLPGSGIYLNTANIGAVRNCEASVIGGNAFTATKVSDCIVTTCGGTGVMGIAIANCRATCTATASAIYGTEVFNSQGTGVDGAGIQATDRAIGCYGTSSSGFGVEAPVAIDCKGISSTNTGVKAIYMASRCMGGSAATGIQTQIADACRVYNNGDSTTIALNAYTASNCYVNANGDGDAINAVSTVNCFASSKAGTAISSLIVRDCYATCTTGYAILSTCATNCYAYSTGANTTLNATKASDCFASNASSGTALQASIAENCVGTSASGTGLNCSGSAMNCYGSSTSGSYGISVSGTATNCRGNRPGGIALYAAIAIGCTASSGSISSPNPYNMP